MGYEADLKLFIDGSWRAGEDRDTHTVINPATGGGIAELPLRDQGRHRRGARRLRARLAEWRATDVEKRGAILAQDRRPAARAGRAYRRDHDPGAGQVLAEARAEVHRLRAIVRLVRRGDQARLRPHPGPPAGQRSMVIQQPVGPTATFTPWNFPIYLLAKKVAAALAAGCTVISRPPQETPGCTGELFRALADAGIPAGRCPTGPRQGRHGQHELLESTIIRKVSFTGSVPVGKQLMKLAADSMTRITLELGGHAPVLIFDDCDLEKTLDMVVPQKFRNAGQVCVSPTRFYVQEWIYEAFLKGFAERTQKVKVGDGLARRHQDGPARQRPPPRSGRRLDQGRPRKGRAGPCRRRTGRRRLLLPADPARRRPQQRRDHERGAVRPGRGHRPSRLSTKRSSRPTACRSASPPSPSPKTAAAPTSSATRSKAAWSASTPSPSRPPTPRSAGSRIQASAARAARKGWRPTRSSRRSIRRERERCVGSKSPRNR